MKPFVIGLALAVVILAASFLAPALLPSTTGPGTLRALEQAELGRRLLHAYDASLPLVGTRSDVAQLKEADFEKLVERSQDAFAQRGKEFSERVRQAIASDRKSNMPESGLRAVSISATGLKGALNMFEKLLRDNRLWLAEAARNSTAANQTDRNALGVGQVAGTVKLVEAAGLLAEARQLRARLVAEQTRAFAAAAKWAAVRTERDHYAGLDVTGIRSGLDSDLDEIKTAVSRTQAEVNELTGAVTDREQALARVRAELGQARAERLNMEEMGFIVGDDASFEAYREKYLQLAERLREVQDQEQLLALGGIRGGNVADDDLLGGEIQGGETVFGLDELRRRLAIAQDKLERYTRARKALEDQTKLVDAVGDDAQIHERQYAARLETLTAEVEQIAGQMAELAQQAFDKEDAALRAAREAETAFKAAGSAVKRWIDDALSLQRQKDPQRANARLKRIVGDDFAPGFATSGEAQAKTLVGRIHTERALALAGYLDTLGRIERLLPGSKFEVGTLQESFNIARDEAVSVLNEARELYQRLARETERKPNWAYLQASLATVYHLLWQIDEFNADQHRSNLIDELGKAVASSRLSPYLQQQVALYDVLTGGVGAPPRLEEEAEELEEEEPIEEEEEEEEEEEPNAP